MAQMAQTSGHSSSQTFLELMLDWCGDTLLSYSA